MATFLTQAGRHDWQRTVLQAVAGGLLGIWLCLLLHIPLYNVGGGEGVWLPWNILAWAVAVSIILMTALMAPVGRMVITPAAKLFFLAVSLLTLPVLWCPESDWVTYALPRLYGLWGGAVFYFALLQCRFSQKIKRLFLWCVTFAALVQGMTLMVSLFHPTLFNAIRQAFVNASGQSPLGVFQQINVTASFLATGLALALALFYRLSLCQATGRAGVAHTWLHRLKSVYLIALLMFFPCMIILTRSRIGWLGGLMVYLIAVVTALLTVRRQRGRRRGLSAACPAAMIMFPLLGMVAGLLLLDGSVAQAMDHAESNHQRWLTLKVTAEMIGLHPWAGWGIGSFMMQFQHYVASHYHPNPSREFMGHPHNEILYVWMEGGIVALAGLVVAGATAVMLWMKNGVHTRRLMGAAMLPVLLHTMVEYPLYLSVPHAFTLLLVVLNLDRPRPFAVAAKSGRTVRSVRHWGELYLRYIAVVICFWMLASLQSAYKENALLSRFEAGKLAAGEAMMTTAAPWILQTRYDTDRLNMELDAYNRSGDLRLLRDFLTGNARWLRTHTDPDNYASQWAILHYLHRDEEACQYLREGHQEFPMDSRFDDEKTCAQYPAQTGSLAESADDTGHVRPGRSSFPEAGRSGASAAPSLSPLNRRAPSGMTAVTSAFLQPAFILRKHILMVWGHRISKG